MHPQDVQCSEGRNYMATTKKTTAAETKAAKTKAVKETATKAVKAATAKATKATAKAETKVTKAPAKTTKAAKETAKKTATKATGTKTATAKRATKTAVTVNVQFNNKSYTTEDLVKIAKDVWRYDLKKKVSDFKTVELYVKPEEGMAYYVINGTEEGSFVI